VFDKLDTKRSDKSDARRSNLHLKLYGLLQFRFKYSEARSERCQETTAADKLQ